MRDIKEVIALSKDFLMYVQGKDYSRQPQPVGKYFYDRRCYYNDLRGKASWQGIKIDGVPALKMATTGETFWFPIDIFLYGLGSLDRYFFDKDVSVLKNIKNVARWMIQHISPSGDFDNQWAKMSPHEEFYSNNSGMAQALGISFAIRVVKYQLCDGEIQNQLEDVIDRMKTNMLLPVAAGGACLEDERGVFFVEFPKKDGNVVLNGWIFSIFGLQDYIHFTRDAEVENVFRRSVETLKSVLPDYHLAGGWALYDNRGRVCSPFYQHLQISLLEALYLLTEEEIFGRYLDKAKTANNAFNRSYYTFNKVMEKLFKDKETYAITG